jgi:hypothetical protein
VTGEWKLVCSNLVSAFRLNTRMLCSQSDLSHSVCCVIVGLFLFVRCDIVIVGHSYSVQLEIWNLLVTRIFFVIR